MGRPTAGARRLPRPRWRCARVRRASPSRSTDSRESWSSSTTRTCAPWSGAGGQTGRAARSAAAPTGRRTVNVAPCPRRRSPRATVPPCSSTRWRTIARPRPRPPWRRVVVESAWRKRSKTCGRNSGAMPSPVSRHAGSRRRRRSGRAGSPRVRPAGVNLIALESRFQTTCWSRSRVAGDRARGRVERHRRSAMPLRLGAGRTESIAASTTAARSTGRGVEAQLAGDRCARRRAGPR